MQTHLRDYSSRLGDVLNNFDWSPVAALTEAMQECWRDNRQVFIAGNGGSAGNAVHLANDLLYPISKRHGSGMRVTALPANPATLTCLANDEGYDKIFSMQLAVMADRGDLLIALSGSGNSANIIAALNEAKKLGMKSFAIVAFSGGEAKALADHVVHFPVDDIQIAEDLQLVVGHMIVQWLFANQDRDAKCSGRLDAG